ncbi:MAG: hypothetical protein LWY06_12170, partial [Firmicutes bacterium]|nr:hypothetical protein [Bacillota bacterium]
MYEKFGATVIDRNKVKFQLYLPDIKKYANPNIKSIHVVGNFQNKMDSRQTDWTTGHNLMGKTDYKPSTTSEEAGVLYTFLTTE